MDIQLIKKLVQIVNDSNIGELKIKEGDFKIEITHKDFVKKQQVSTSLSAPSIVTTEVPKANTNEATTPNKIEKSTSSSTKTVKAPMIGTFYRSSGPDKEPFVKVGDSVKVGDVLCVIESMKLFNEIKSEVSGKVVKVIVDNAQAVEYDQALFIIE